MTENVKKVITFAAGEGNKPLGIFRDKDSEFPLFTVVKLNLMIRAKHHLFITVQYESGNSEVKIEE